MIACDFRLLQAEVISALSRELRLEQALVLVGARAGLLRVDHVQVELIDFLQSGLRQGCLMSSLAASSSNELGNCECRPLIVRAWIEVRNISIDSFQMPGRSCVDADIDGCLWFFASGLGHHGDRFLALVCICCSLSRCALFLIFIRTMSSFYITVLFVATRHVFV